MSEISKFLKSVPARNIVSDSRKVVLGDVFVAISGLTVDGHDFIPEVIKKGAVAVVGEKSLKNLTVPYLKVKNTRQALSLLASEFYGNPSRKLRIIGVTGTDGKTTTSSIIYHLLNSAGKKVGLVSTVSAKIGNKQYDTGFHVTNPEPVALQKFLSLMVREGCIYAVLETTSHGLDQDRVYGLDYEISVLTNITREHLDYHKTYEKYLKTKAKLFLNSKTSILNKDDASFDKIAKIVKKYLTYSKNGLKGEIKKAVEKRFPEEYNRSNAAAAVAVAIKLGLKKTKIAKAILSFHGVKGRMEEIKNKKGIRIIVDYAHTPNAVESLLKTLKLSTKRKLISITSAEGERDPGKRIDIPKAAVKYSDITILNPIDTRSEDPKKILSEMEKGAKLAGGEKDKNFYSFLDRGDAIHFAINNLAKKGDTVVICGKGHETGMDFKSVELPWSDQEAVKMALKGKVKKLQI